MVAWLLTLPAAAAIGARDLRRHARSSAPGRWGRCWSPWSPSRSSSLPSRGASQQGAPVPAELIDAVVVETKELLETVVASLVAGVGVTAVFSVAIWGAARFVELSRGDRPVAAGAAAALGVLALAATLGAVVVGIVVMASK